MRTTLYIALMLVAGLTANARGEEKSPLDRTLRAWLKARSG